MMLMLKMLKNEPGWLTGDEGGAYSGVRGSKRTGSNKSMSSEYVIHCHRITGC